MQPWMHKLGFVVPSWNTVIEYETARMLPASASMHVSRISHTSDTIESLQHMIDLAPEHLTLVSDPGTNAICFACTAAGFVHGVAHDRDQVARWTAQAGRPVISTAGSFLEASSELGLRKLAIAAPYEEWLMTRLSAYLTEAGFEVISSKGLGHQANVLYGPEKAVELARSAWNGDADGLILSCSNFRTLEAIDEIEALIGKPVITSNTSALWALLRRLRWSEPIQGAGRLMQMFAPEMSGRELLDA